MISFKNRKTCFIIAEISANHSQDFQRAVTLIKKAKDAGANAVKFQVYKPDTLTIDCNSHYFRVKHPKWGGQTLYQLYKKAYTPWEWLSKLKKTADDLGILFFATAFDQAAVDFLEDLRVPLHKIASFELVDLPLIEYAAKTEKPLILSTGMATLSEIREAVNSARHAGAKEVVLLKCVSSYPARPEQMNLMTIPYLKRIFHCPVGLSDHTLDIAVSIAAVSLGAQVIEKHLTISRRIKTPDSFFSLEPDELKDLVRNIRIAEKAKGRVYCGLTEEEKKSRVFRRSLFCVKDIKMGEPFTLDNLKSIRPADGLKPKYLKLILAKKARRGLKKGTPLKFAYIDGS